MDVDGDVGAGTPREVCACTDGSKIVRCAQVEYREEEPEDPDNNGEDRKDEDKVKSDGKGKDEGDNTGKDRGDDRLSDRKLLRKFVTIKLPKSVQKELSILSPCSFSFSFSTPTSPFFLFLPNKWHVHHSSIFSFSTFFLTIASFAHSSTACLPDCPGF